MLLIAIWGSSLVPEAQAASPLSGFNPAGLADAGNHAFAEATSFFGSSALPASEVFNNHWNSGGDYNAYWNAATGVTFNGVRIAIINRGELFVKESNDTQSFFYSERTQSNLTVGKIYNINASAHGFAASGVELSYGHSLGALLPGLDIGITLRGLRPTTMQDGNVTGNVTPITGQTYNTDMNLNYFYDKNYIYKRTGGNLEGGLGYSGDIGLSYKRDSFLAECVVRDIAGVLIWDSAPYTDAVLTTNTHSTTTGGYQTFSPAIQGIESQKKYYQHIPLKTDFIAQYDNGNYDGSFTVNLIDNDPHYWLEAGYNINKSLKLSVGYNVEYSAAQVSMKLYNFTAAVLTDNIDVDKVKCFGFQIAYSFAW
jgi:hypothetical protein